MLHSTISNAQVRLNPFIALKNRHPVGVSLLQARDQDAASSLNILGCIGFDLPYARFPKDTLVSTHGWQYRTRSLLHWLPGGDKREVALL